MALEIRGEDDGDYFRVVCKRCDTATKNELRRDGTVPCFKATCPKCKEEGEWKISEADWKGLP